MNVKNETKISLSSMKSGTKVHMIGIGGVSMAPLAEVLQSAGMVVSGSDGMESATVEGLRGLGIPVAIGHKAEHLGQAEVVIRTAAVHEDNPEIAKARETDVPVFERAEGWGAIMQQYQNALCIAGTHGKTTTTAMCSEIFLTADRDPTIMLGGVLPRLGKGHAMGKGQDIILESCEYCNSFHHFFPTVAVILNVEEDHLDYFKDLAEIKASFATFAEKVPQHGLILVNGEDENSVDTVKHLPHQCFGLESGDIHCENLRWTGGFPTFELVYQGENLGEIKLIVPGEHNVKNALAAAGTALFLGVPFDKIREGLGQFTGAGRRFQHKGTYHEAVVVDDYAHHPTELKALLSAVKELDYKRTICVFQPHTFTRTKAFFEEFAEVLAMADVAVLVDIYAAREADDGSVSSQMLAEKIPDSIYGGSHENTLKHLQEMAKAGDLILTVGAGDVVKIGQMLVESQ